MERGRRTLKLKERCWWGTNIEWVRAMRLTETMREWEACYFINTHYVHCCSNELSEWSPCLDACCFTCLLFCWRWTCLSPSQSHVHWAVREKWLGLLMYMRNSQFTIVHASRDSVLSVTSLVFTKRADVGLRVQVMARGRGREWEGKKWLYCKDALDTCMQIKGKKAETGEKVASVHSIPGRQAASQLVNLHPSSDLLNRRERETREEKARTRREGRVELYFFHSATRASGTLIFSHFLHELSSCPSLCQIHKWYEVSHYPIQVDERRENVSKGITCWCTHVWDDFSDSLMKCKELNRTFVRRKRMNEFEAQVNNALVRERKCSAYTRLCNCLTSVSAIWGCTAPAREKEKQKERRQTKESKFDSVWERERERERESCAMSRCSSSSRLQLCYAHSVARHTHAQFERARTSEWVKRTCSRQVEETAREKNCIS